jgi:hypothetical protein
VSKFPLLQKETMTKLVQTLEGQEVSKISYGRTVKPSKPIETLAEVNAYCDQLQQAMLYYGNVMELPYCTEYAVDLGNPMHSYAVETQDSCLYYSLFSRMNLLSPKDRDKRKEIFDKTKNDKEVFYELYYKTSAKPKAADDAIEGVINAEE